MTHSFHFAVLAGLLLVTALGYTLATIGMKLASGTPGGLAFLCIFAGLGIAVVTEIVLLRQGNMSLVYLGIIVAETVLVLVYASSIGNGLTHRRWRAQGW